MDNDKVLESFISYCDDMKVGNEGFIKNQREKKQLEKKWNNEESDKYIRERNKHFKKEEPNAKALLIKIGNDFIQELKRQSIRYIHYKPDIDKNTLYYEGDPENDGELWISYEFNKQCESDEGWRESRECFNKTDKIITEKYKSQLEKYEKFDIIDDDGYLWFYLSIPYKPDKSEIVTESAKQMDTLWNEYNKKLVNLRSRIDNENDIAKIVSLLDEYSSLLNKLNDAMNAQKYSFSDNMKRKIHNFMSKALPLTAFIATTGGVMAFSKYMDDHLHIGSSLIAGTVAGVATSIKVGSPGDKKRGHLNEIESLINEVKAQKKLMKALLNKGIKTMDDTEEYNIEVSESGIKIEKI